MLKRVKKLLFGMCFALLILVNGCAPKNGFHNEGSKTYYYRDGEKLYGWLKIDNNWYYSKLEGHEGILKSTRLQDGDAYYLLDKEGKMVTDKIVDGMYFGVDGKQVFNSMIEIDGNSYVIDNEGIAKKMPDYQLVWDTKLPKTFRGMRTYISDIIINEISYEVSNKNLVIYFSGEAGKGPNERRGCEIKIYDSDNIPVYSGTFCTDSALVMGEKFILNKHYVYDFVLRKKGIYRLVLMDVE